MITKAPGYKRKVLKERLMNAHIQVKSFLNRNAHIIDSFTYLDNQCSHLNAAAHFQVKAFQDSEGRIDKLIQTESHAAMVYLLRCCDAGNQDEKVKAPHHSSQLQAIASILPKAPKSVNFDVKGSKA